MGHNESFLIKLKNSAAKYWLHRQETDISSSYPEAQELLKAVQKHQSKVLPFPIREHEKPHPSNEDSRPSRTLTPAFDKKIAEENKKLSQDILHIVRKPLEKNKRKF